MPRHAATAKPKKSVYRRVVTYNLSETAERETFEEALETNDFEFSDSPVWGRTGGPQAAKQKALQERNKRNQNSPFTAQHEAAASSSSQAAGQQQGDPLMQLLELYGGLIDPAIVHDVYTACDCSFDASLQVLSDMAPPVEEAQAILASQAADDGAGSSAGGSAEAVCFWDMLHESEKEAVLSCLSSRDLARVAWTCKDFASRVRCGRVAARSLVIPTGVSLSAVLGMVAGHPNARAISLVRWGSMQLRDADFRALITAIAQGACSSRRAVRVEAFSLRGWSSASDTNIVTLLETLPHLKELDLSDCGNLTDAMLGPISRYQRPPGSEPAATPAPFRRNPADFPPLPPSSNAVGPPVASSPAPSPAAQPSTSAGGLTVLYRADPNRTPPASGLAGASSSGARVGGSSGSWTQQARAGPGSGAAAVEPSSRSVPHGASWERNRAALSDRNQATLERNQSSDDEEDYDVVRRAAASDDDADDDDFVLLDEEIAAREQRHEHAAAARREREAAQEGATGAGSASASVPPRPISRSSSAGGATPGSLPRAHGQGSFLLGTSPVGPNSSILGSSPVARSPSPSPSGAASLGKGGSMGSLGKTMFSKYSGGGGARPLPPSTSGSFTAAGQQATPTAASTSTIPSSSGSGSASARGIEVLCLAGCSQISADGIRALLQAPVTKECLRALDVSRCNRMTRAALVLPPGSNLAVFKAAECQNLHEVLMQLPFNCPLQELWLNNCRQLTKLHVVGPRLSLLHVGGCKNLFKLQLRCPRLTQLLANQCAKLSEVDAEDVQAPCLEELNLFGCRSLTSPALDALITGCPRLQLLNVNGCLSLADITLEGGHADVRAVDVSGCKQLGALRVASPQLTTLTARACHQLVTLVVESLALTAMDLTNCSSLRILAFPALQPALTALQADWETAAVLAARPRTHPSQQRLVTDCAVAAALLLAAASIVPPHVRALGCEGLPAATLLACKVLRAAAALPRPKPTASTGDNAAAGDAAAQ